jgi:hypothetical protein
MPAAARVKQHAAMRASVTACHVLPDGHFIAASAAENRRPVPLLARPDLDWMAGQSLMTFLAGVIGTAALHLDGDYVESGSIVGAASLRIQVDSANFRVRRWHTETA